jgi:hypothetical protein
LKTIELCKKPIETKTSEPNHPKTKIRRHASLGDETKREQPESDLVRYTKQYVNRNIDSETYKRFLKNSGFNPNSLGV